MNQIQAFLLDQQPKFHNKFLTFSDFNEILLEIGKLDKRCIMEQNTIQELYDYVYNKQNSQVTYQIVLGLTIEILKELTSLDLNTSQQEMWQRIVPFLDIITTNTIHQMKYIFESLNCEQNQGICIDFISAKIWENNQLEEEEKSDIDLLFKIIQDDEYKVDSQKFGEFVSILEQYVMKQIQGEQEQAKDIPEEQVQKDSFEEEEKIKNVSFHKFEYISDLISKFDTLKSMKNGNIGKYESVLEEILNNLVFFGEKFNTFQREIDLLSSEKKQAFKEKMNLEQNGCYLQIEMKKMKEYKDSLEREIDCLYVQLEELEKKNELLGQEAVVQKSIVDNLQLEGKMREIEKKKLQECEQKYSILLGKYNKIQQENEEIFVLNQQLQQNFVNQNSKIEQINSQFAQKIDKQQFQQQEYLALKQENEHILEEIKRENAQVELLKSQIEEKDQIIQNLQQTCIEIKEKYESQMLESNKIPFKLNPRKSEALQQQQYSKFSRLSIGLNNRIKPISKIVERISFNHSFRDNSINSTSSIGRYKKIKIKNQKIKNIKRQSINFDKFWNNIQLKTQQSEKIAQNSIQATSQYNKEIDQQYAKDYLSLRESPKIHQILLKYSDIDDIEDQRCFSDSIFRINNQNERERRVLLATSYNIFILDPNEYKFIRRIQIDRISQITFLNKSAYLCIIGIKQEYDYVIETYRRADFNIFLIQTIKKRNLELYKVQFSDEVNIQFRGAKDKINTLQIDENTLLNRFQASYKSASIVGFVELASEGWILSTSWVEYFFVLSNIGLFSFLKPGDSQPLLFIPISDALVVKDPCGYSKKYCIKIFYQNSDKYYVLSCQSRFDQEKWIDNIRKVNYQSIHVNAKRDQNLKNKYLQGDSIQEVYEEDC